MPFFKNHAAKIEIYANISKSFVRFNATLIFYHCTKKKSPAEVNLRGSPLKGGDFLLSRFPSTIGVARFNCSVRNGKRWSPCAIVAFLYPSAVSYLTPALYV